MAELSPDRFWSLVDLLGGRVDAAGVARLEEALLAADVEETLGFADELDALVSELVVRCTVVLDPDAQRVEVPDEVAEPAELVATAVVAAGRETHDRVLGAGQPLSSREWAWREAALLLEAGMGDERLDDLEGPDVLLQWRTTQVPDRVDTDWDADALGGLDLGVDPTLGVVLARDPDLEEALLRLQADPEYQRRRALIDGIDLHLVVSEVAEPELTAWPTPEAVEHAVLEVPVGTFDLDGSPRTDTYLDLVVTLVVSVQEQLGDPA
ncbi:hypothetical protein [Nocardioides sp. Leaf307]|uniref:hypothetical protein n=1 Tax=Nocardioides sp. Leaf307 TaxID=1736331 RepID=UPI0007025100|nr:hypothetical protein [Nocardioides sp. Leaf307]KQQ43597.1 hypothetical protein ASF50_06650 [Nocardioides sp. Leaf307]